MAAVYFLISLLATTIGAMTGMGGGVIIKPVLDMMHHYDAATVGVLSSLTVLIMSLVSVLKQIRQKAKIIPKIVIPLALGSVWGGNLGNRMFSVLLRSLGDSETASKGVTIVQNTVLALLIILVFLYMLRKDSIRSFHFEGILPSLLTGVFLGVCSSFLGIGGGPINVALLILLFSFDTKTAAVCSIFTILFAQVSKVGDILLSPGGLSSYDLSMLLPMAIGAVAGGFIGSKLNKELPERTVDKMFNAVQILVFVICLFNIIRNLP